MKHKKISEEVLGKGEWLTLKRARFLTEDNKTVIWEIIERSRNPLALGIIARLVPSNRYVLIKQFRQGINNYVIGLPAGIVAEDESDMAALDKAILKELKEETGYTGVITSKSPRLKSNPAVMKGDVIMVTADIDETSELNQNPKQELEAAEDIEAILLKPEEIQPYLIAQKANGVDIGSGVWLLAQRL